MNSKSQFAALEIMSREKAALARKEMEYWLSEADEWKRLQEQFQERLQEPLRDCPAPSIETAPTPLDHAATPLTTEG
jgi:hypothetical protein